MNRIAAEFDRNFLIPLSRRRKALRLLNEALGAFNRAKCCGHRRGKLMLFGFTWRDTGVLSLRWSTMYSPWARVKCDKSGQVFRFQMYPFCDMRRVLAKLKKLEKQ